jgi:pimeloyl-ACP methyl ester carboxylesterase
MLILLTLLACKREILEGLPNEPGGNPLIPGEAMYPFPSDFYRVDGRVVYPAEALPGGLPPEMFESDGFSRMSPILALLEGGVDPASISDTSVRLIRSTDYADAPILAEVDLQSADPLRRALIVRPEVGLDYGTTYVVVLTDELRTLDGAIPEPTDAFRALRDGIRTDSDAVESLRDDFETVNDVIAGVGLEPEEVVLAWSFTTRSEGDAIGPVVAIHDAMATAELGPWTVLSDTIEGDNRLIEGTFTVPDFLGAEGLVLDGGVPVAQGERVVKVLVTIPVTVDGPRPVMLFGHGFFSSRYEPTWSSLNGSLQRWAISAVTIDFIGFNEDDQLDTIGVLAGDLQGLPLVVDQQAQSQAQFTALARLVREQLTLEYPELDATNLSYMGISNGGTQGLAIATASPEITRAALVVPGGAWSHMLQRAVQWNTMGTLLENQYPDPVDLQLATALTQGVFDRVDSLSFVDHLVDDRLPGRPPAEITLHMAVGDCQVANVVTEWAARTAGVPLMTPAPYDIEGLDTVAAPEPGVAAALLVYDENYPALPEGNVPPAEDNGAHETIRLTEAYKEQMGTFLETGRIVQVCDGACDPD